MKKTVLIFYTVFAVVFSAFSLAPEPTSQPTAMQFGSIKSYGFVMSFTTTTADGYLIFKSDKSITDVPVDGTTYEKGQGLSSCKVMYVGANNINSVREILEGTKYYFKVFAYNGTNSQINYKQANPLTDSVMSLASDAGNYYSAIDSNSGTFLADLHTLINNHTLVAYVSYKYNIVPIIFERDTTGGKTVVNCEYSNETTIYTPPFDFVALNYSREHVLCKSWMTRYPQLGASITDSIEGADYFNLLLTRLDSVNSVRSNYSLGIPVTGIKTHGEFTYGLDANSNKVYEPKQDRRGDAARNMFYEMICYNGLSGNWGLDNLLSFANQQNQNTLKLWNQQDPPDKFERTKNEYIYSIQHNRNPFIDHPDWATCLNFDSILKTNLCGAVSGIQDETHNFISNIYPNPSTHILNVELSGIEFQEAEISVFNIYGFEVMRLKTQNPYCEINTGNFEAGNYLLKVFINGNSGYRKFLVLK